MNTILKLVFCADVILIPTPFYGVIVEDVKLYSDVNLYHVPLDCEVRKQDTYFAVQFDLWSVWSNVSFVLLSFYFWRLMAKIVDHSTSL